MQNRKCGYVALIGIPNAGKSTLLNTLIESKISIVTPKPQTTRANIRGITQHENTQIIFVDTPGIFNATPRFEKAMVEAAWSGAKDSDITVLVVDAKKGLDAETLAIAKSLGKTKKPAVFVLNKIDKVKKETLPALAQALYDIHDFDRSFMVSALKGDGLKEIISYLAASLPDSEWLYPEDEITDASERNIAAEITREQCFFKLHSELPYGIMVETEKWEENMVKGQRTIRINQVIVLAREAHKKIILGKKGEMLKAIGTAARQKIGYALSANVQLFLFVKVNENWKEDPASFAAMGLEYRK